MSTILPEATDLSHHLSALARARSTPPFTAFKQYLGRPGLLGLAAGLPRPNYFPFLSVGGDVFQHDSFTSLTPQGTSVVSLSPHPVDKTFLLQIPKYGGNHDSLSLANVLQYTLASGTRLLHEFLQDFSGKVYRPAYSNYRVLASAGNSDGWAKVAMTLCNPGEYILADEWVYPSATAMIRPHGIKPVPVPLDGEGIKSEDLRTILAGWNEAKRGGPRPHVLYTIPVGQNPTGATTQAARKKEVYDICVEFDLIIVEDDPYYFLQQQPYIAPADRSNTPSEIYIPSDDDYINQLAPSYLRFDYQGRVIRLDTFSKTIAPGCRLGWYTCNPIFFRRLELMAETTSRAPSSFSQTLVTNLMLNWRYEGYLHWLKALGYRYQLHRDSLVDGLYEEFRIEVSTGTDGCPLFLAFLKDEVKDEAVPEKEHSNPVPVFSFTPPRGGMFLWIKVHFKQHPSYLTLGNSALENALWTALAEAGVLLAYGSMFAADDSTIAMHPEEGHFRISFSDAEGDDMKEAIRIFASVLKVFYAS